MLKVRLGKVLSRNEFNKASEPIGAPTYVKMM